MIVMEVCERRKSTITVTQSEDVYEVMKKFCGKRVEHFWVITLSSSAEVIAIRLVTVGILNRNLLHPREVFWQAIRDNAASIILVHNHPSGNTDPSSDDDMVTSRIHRAGELMGIEVLDHVIIGKRGYYSYKANGKI
jgi:DNA repair protein RadC